MSLRGAKRIALLSLALLATMLFTTLGVWQVQRRAWKLALIERVEQRIRASPVPVPSRADWPHLSRENAEYRRVTARGVFRHGSETLVQAVTERGPGFWVMTPLLTEQGPILVNRGFVPPERRQPESRVAGLPAGPVQVTGLLRITEPGGGFLRSNDPAHERWYSRDVAAIAQARGLAGAAPFFIDADAAPNAGGWPVGGLTVVRFRNAHLSYALTWFALAALSTWGVWFIWRRR